MKERTRRVIFAVVSAVAVLGAVALMASSLLGESPVRTALQLGGAGAAVGCGIVSGVLAWHWWSAQWLESRRSRL